MHATFIEYVLKKLYTISAGATAHDQAMLKPETSGGRLHPLEPKGPKPLSEDCAQANWAQEEGLTALEGEGLRLASRLAKLSSRTSGKLSRGGGEQPK